MKEEKHNLYAVLCSVITLIAIIEAQSYVEYVSPAVLGQVDYTKHDLYSDGVRVQNTSFITFRVKCDGNANILLQRNRSDYKKEIAEITIGASNNQGVSISDKPSTKYTWCMNATGVLSALEYRYFWISWDNDTILVGKGNIPHTHAFKCSEEISFNVQYISIGTSKNTRGYWKFDIAPILPTQRTSSLTNEVSTTPSTDHRKAPTLPTQRTSSLTNEVSTTPSTDPRKEEEVNDQSAVYISVTIVIALLLTAIIVLIYRKQRHSRKLETELAADYSANGFAVATGSVVPGIENPSYSMRRLETRENRNGAGADVADSDPVNYTESVLNGDQASGTTAKVYAIVVDNTKDTLEDVTNENLTNYSEVSKAAYSHIRPGLSCESKNTSNEEYDNNENNKMLRVTEGKGDSRTPKGDSEDLNSVYDHAATGKQNVGQFDTEEYSHLKIRPAMNKTEATPIKTKTSTSNALMTSTLTKTHFSAETIPTQNTSPIETNASTTSALITSPFTNASTSAETERDEGIAFYITVATVVVIAVVIALIAILYHRRKKRKKRINTDSVAVYNGMNDFTCKKRNSVAGIVNRAYSEHVLEIQENKPFSNTEMPQSNDSLYTKIDSREIHPETTLTKEENEAESLYPEIILDDRTGYNYVTKPMQEFNDTNYCHVTKTQEGFRIENDTSYSHIISRQDESGQNFTLSDCGNGSTLNKTYTTPRVSSGERANISKRLRDQDSIYDHAKAGGPDPEVKEADEYSHLNGVKEREKRDIDIAPRHGYENVAGAKDFDFDENSIRLTQDNFGSFSSDLNRAAKDLSDANGNEDIVIAKRHEYVNITKDKEEPGELAGVNATGGYEQAIGITPTYFVVEP